MQHTWPRPHILITTLNLRSSGRSSDLEIDEKARCGGTFKRLRDRDRSKFETSQGKVLP